jgi:hypothetical protein
MGLLSNGTDKDSSLPQLHSTTSKRTQTVPTLPNQTSLQTATTPHHKSQPSPRGELLIPPHNNIATIFVEEESTAFIVVQPKYSCITAHPYHPIIVNRFA